MSTILRKPREPNPDLDTAGRRAFDAVMKARKLTDQQVAERLKCTRGAVNNWRNGHASPEDVYRAAIEILYGIPRDSWNPARVVKFLEDIKREAARAA